jgi:hypothetical protein
VNGSNQVVSVETKLKNEQVVGANCKLDNGKGIYYVTTSGTVTVNRAYDDMQVKCEKDGLPTGIAAVKSNTKAMAFGNILFGGFIGAAVDAGTGAAYDYPPLISVIMGEATAPSTPVSTPAASSAETAPDPVAQK